MPKKLSLKHFLLILWISAGAFVVNVFLHNAFYALGILCFGVGFWEDEPVFFVIALLVVPAGFVMGAVGRIWVWCVVQPIEEMKARGIQLPTTWPYFAPFGCYGWLWKFCRGIEIITDRRMRAGGAFCLVFFLGIIGMIIIRVIIRDTLSKVAT